MTVVAAGWPIERRSMDDVVAVFAGLLCSGASARLSIVGDGPRCTPIEQRVAELGLAGAVGFEGGRSLVRFANLLARADVFVSTSRSES